MASVTGRHTATATPTATREHLRSSTALLETLRRVVRELRLAGKAAEQRTGVHGAQLAAMQCLQEAPASSLTDLADRTHTDISSVSVVVSRLVERGLVARSADPLDRRRLSLSLTTQGKGMMRRAPETPRDRLLDASLHLSARELSGLVNSLGKLADALDREGSTA